MAYRTYSITNGFLVAANGTGDFPTLAAANAVAPAGTVIGVQPGTYTDNFTITPGVSFVAMQNVGVSGGVVFSGSISYFGGLPVTFSGIELVTNDALYNIGFNGTSRGTINFYDCNLLSNSFGNISVINSHPLSVINLINCVGDVISPSNIQAIIALSFAGNANLNYCMFTNSGLSNATLYCQSGNLNISFCSINSQIQTAQLGNLILECSTVDTSAINISPLSISSSNSVPVPISYGRFSKLIAGTAPAITFGNLGNFIAENIIVTSSNAKTFLNSGKPFNATLQIGSIETTNFTLNYDTNLTLTYLLTNIGDLQLTLPLPVSSGGTGLTSLSLGSIYYGSGSSTLLSVLTPGSNGDILQLASGVPKWTTATFPITVGGAGTILRSDGTNWAATTATYPATTTVNQLLFSSAGNAIGGLSTANNGVLVTSNSGVPSILAGGSAGQVLQSVSGAAPAWSTPTYPSASGSAGQIIRSDGTNNVYTTSTYPNTNAVNTLLYASSANVMAALATANSSILVTSAGGVPSLSGTLPFTVPVTTGGTGLATLTAHSIQVGAGTSNVTQLAVGATGTVLTGVTGADPAFSATPTVTSITFGSGTALNTYVQGTFTPVLKFGGGTTGITYTNQVGNYAQIGNILFFNIYILLSSKGSSTGVATITGLPVVAAINSGCAGAYYGTLTATTGVLTSLITATSATINLTQYISSTGVSSTISDTNFGNTSFLLLSGQYFTS